MAYVFHPNARLITSPTIPDPGPKQPLLFRKKFSLAEPPRHATLRITAHGCYIPYINNEPANSLDQSPKDTRNHHFYAESDQVFAPGWTSYNHHLAYQTFDVTSILRKGHENVLAVVVGEGWFCGRLGFNGGRRDIYGSRMGLLAQLEVDGEVVVTSDASWKVSTGPIVSSEIYDGEVYDATFNLAVEGWRGWSGSTDRKTDFSDDHWDAVEEIGVPNAELVVQKGPPVRRIDILGPKKVLRSPAGNPILDFGQNLVGRLRVGVLGKAGDEVVFTHAEVLQNGSCATRPLRNCRATDTLILSGEFVWWEPSFTFHGFRYVEVAGWPTGEKLRINAVTLHSNMKRTGTFECSNEMINKLHECIRWGMKGNFLSIPTDCPQRDERLGWTGDIQIFAPTASFLYDISGFLSDWLRDLASEQLLDCGGVPPLVCPNVIDTALPKAQAVWADCVILTPYDLYQAYGDKQILLDQLASMKAWIDQSIPRQANGLWDPSAHQLGDWLDPTAPPSDPGNGRTDPSLVANAYLVRITDAMEKISAVLVLQEDEKRYKADAARLRKEFQAEYITPNGRLAPETMTSLALALHHHLFRNHAEETAAAARLAYLVRKTNFKIATGFVGTPLILPVLTKYGYSDLAYRMLLEEGCPSWLYPVTMDATTMWERWDSMLPDGSVNPGNMTSFNHYALGSVGHWIHSTIGGISPLEPGWKKFNVEPIPGGQITWLNTKFDSRYGLVICSWRIKDGMFSMLLVVPEDTTASVKLPQTDFVRQVGSGRHKFRTAYTEGPWPPEAINDPFSS